LKDDRHGKFQLSWYENRIKQWQDVTNPNDEQQSPLLSHALQQADDKSWYRLSRRKQIIEEHFGRAPWDDDWNPRYNIAPTQPVPVIRQHPKSPCARFRTCAGA
jgi:hypothetical protein